MTTEQQYESLLQLLRERRSIRRFTGEPLTRAQIDRLLEAARWAPSASNRQQHRFIVIRSRAVIGRLAEHVRRAGTAFAEHVSGRRAQVVAGYLRDFEHFTGAPVVIAVSYRAEGTGLLAAAARRDDEQSAARAKGDALSSAAAAIMNLLLAAHALGLGACWMTGPLIAREALSAELALAAGWDLAALVPVGYAAETPAPPPRRALERLVRYLD